MSWWNPFKKEEEAPAAEATPKSAKVAPAKSVKVAPAPTAPDAEPPEAKGMMAMFYRKWKDPAFVKQMKIIAAHMAKEGVNVKDASAVKAWVEKNKKAIEDGKFSEIPDEGAKQETFVKTGPDVGRNDPCTCGSGKKFKKCHGA